MNTLIRVTKLYDAKAYVPVQFQPWLDSIADSVDTITIGDAPDVVETYTLDGALVQLTLAGGSIGQKYRIPVTCVSLQRAMSRTVVVELSIPGTNAAPAPATGGGSTSGNVDGGGPDTNYTSTDPIDGGTP